MLRRLMVPMSIVAALAAIPIWAAEAQSPGRGGRGGERPDRSGERRQNAERPGPPGGREMGGRNLPPMSEEERAELDRLGEEVRKAADAYREKKNDATLAALKKAVAERFEFQQKSDIARTQKLLEELKKRDDNKEQEINRMLERFTNPRGENQRPGQRRGGPPAK